MHLDVFFGASVYGPVAPTGACGSVMRERVLTLWSLIISNVTLNHKTSHTGHFYLIKINTSSES